MSSKEGVKSDPHPTGGLYCHPATGNLISGRQHCFQQAALARLCPKILLCWQLLLCSASMLSLRAAQSQDIGERCPCLLGSTVPALSAGVGSFRMPSPNDA